MRNYLGLKSIPNAKRVTLRCPYCDFEQTVELLEGYKVNSITCDPEDGGCERDYAAKLRLTPVVSVYKLIEWKEF